MNKLHEHDIGVGTPPHSGHGDGGDRWAVGFFLGRPLTRAEQKRFEATVDPGLGAVCVRLDNQMIITVAAYGPMDEALTDVVPRVHDAFREAGISDVEFQETWMVNHADMAKRVVVQQPIRYYSVTESAKALGISRQRVLQLMTTGKFPAPDAYVGNRPAWLGRHLAEWAARRKKK